MRKEHDVIVIGAGIVGLMTARELLASGARVRVLERGEAGCEATHAAGGILSPMPPWDAPASVTVLADWGRARYQSLVAELAQETGIDGEWIDSGILLFDPAISDAAIAWGRASGRKVELLDAPRLSRLEPAVGDEWSQAVRIPDVAQVRNHRLARALVASLRARGVEISEHNEVRGLHVQRAVVAGVQTAHGTLHCHAVVLCAGAWSDELLRPWSAELSVRPMRGQMLWYRTEPGLVRHMLLAQTHYLVPRRDGVCIVGSTVEDVGFDKRTTAGATDELVAAARRLCAALKGRLPQGQWAGLRPRIADGVPRIGAHPLLRGLFVNAGHYRNGIVLAPGSARLAAELVLGRAPSFDPEPYVPRGPEPVRSYNRAS